EDTAQCLLIIIGATPEGSKELVGLTDGVRESAQSWRELLLDLKRRGVSIGPELAVADGALGFWQRSKRDGPRRAARAAGCRKPPTSSTNCRPASNQKPSGRCRTSGWPRPRRMRSRPSTPASRAGASNTTRQSSA